MPAATHLGLPVSLSHAFGVPVEYLVTGTSSMIPAGNVFMLLQSLSPLPVFGDVMPC